jgi:deoxyribodipyrimidine photo-lyase
MEKNWGIHWFRRDLRIPGNSALRQNWKETNGKVLGLFCFDSLFLSREDFSHNRFAFFLKTLRQLKSELQKQGSDLLVVDCLPQDFYPQFFNYLKNKKIDLPSHVSWNRDYEPFARQRDEKVKNIIETFGVQTLSARDHLIIEPWEIQKNDELGSFYQVYSPYFRKWLEKLKTPEIQKRIEIQLQAKDYYQRLNENKLTKVFSANWNDFTCNSDFPFIDQLEKFESTNNRSVTIKIPEAGFAAAFERLQNFKNSAHQYKEQRDFPDNDGTSKLSHFQKNGSLVSSQILAEIQNVEPNWEKNEGTLQFVKEIAWREFYYAIMYNRPDCEKNSFLKHYNNLHWENNTEWFKRWCEGNTGFPIVDAGMRQLNQTGWMHNRVRMIVASFLTKDLLIDWRWGENYFMKMLLDGDLAPNNGGWQWAASTGCDPQPYFRIFNPWLQGEKFDPDAHYIKTYVPELKNLDAKIIHDPDGDRSRFKYPKPIITHSEQKIKALALFKSAQTAKPK